MLFPEDNSIESRVIVVNKYRVKSSFIDITRGNSVLCNPSKVGDRSRAQALVDFNDHMQFQLDKSPDSPFRKEMVRILRLLLDGKTVRLGCVCKPKACHGDIIRQKLIKTYKKMTGE